MESFKKLVYSLKETVETLQKKVMQLEGRPTTLSLPSGVQYTSESMDAGVYPLDDYDTFRFVFEKDGNKYIYYLLNPCEELLELIEETTKIHINCAVTNFRICSEYGPETVESDYEILYTVRNGNYDTIQTLKNRRIREILDSKVWEIKPRSEGVRFYRTIRFDFGNTYKIPPHVSCYITEDPEKYNIVCRRKDITTKHVVIQIEYGQEQFNSQLQAAQLSNITNSYKTHIKHNGLPDDTTLPSSMQLHWQVNGIVEKKDVPIDKLLDLHFGST